MDDVAITEHREALIEAPLLRFQKIPRIIENLDAVQPSIVIECLMHFSPDTQLCAFPRGLIPEDETILFVRSGHGIQELVRLDEVGIIDKDGVEVTGGGAVSRVISVPCINIILLRRASGSATS